MGTTHIELEPVIAPTQPRVVERVEFTLAFGAAASIVFSIAISQILLGAGLLVRLISRKPLNFSKEWLPLGIFWALTLLSVILSPDPSRGAIELKKIFVFGLVPLIYETFESVAQVRWLVLAWTLGASASALIGLGQSYLRWHDAITLRAPLYDYVLDGRITGFQGHWMTFGGVQMIVLVFLLAFLLLGDPGKWKAAGWACAALIWSVLILGFTRSIFLAGVPAGALVLIWASRQWWLIAVPAVAALLLFMPSAAPIRERAISALIPHGDVDSNSRRVLMLRTGLRMIEAHPILGIGPGQVESQFDRYLPGDAPKPLPKGWYGHLHNVYVQYAAERGIPALLCFAWLLVKMIRDARSAIASHLGATWVQYAVLAVIAAVLAEGPFEYNLGDSEVLTMFLAVIACGYATQRSARALTPTPAASA